MTLKEFEHHRCHIHAAPLHLDIPGLVINASTGNIDIVAMQGFVFTEYPFFLRPHFNAARDLPVAALHAVT